MRAHQLVRITLSYGLSTWGISISHPLPPVTQGTPDYSIIPQNHLCIITNHSHLFNIQGGIEGGEFQEIRMTASFPSESDIIGEPFCYIRSAPSG
jgi:hypothetical protein